MSEHFPIWKVPPCLFDFLLCFACHAPRPPPPRRRWCALHSFSLPLLIIPHRGPCLLRALCWHAIGLREPHVRDPCFNMGGMSDPSSPLGTMVWINDSTTQADTGAAVRISTQVINSWPACSLRLKLILSHSLVRPVLIRPLPRHVSRGLGHAEPMISQGRSAQRSARGAHRPPHLPVM